MSESGQIPQSPALGEVSEDSLAELFSRDPEGFQAQDRQRLVAALREQRKRWETAEASGTTRRERTKLSGPSSGLTTDKSAEELGI